MFQRKSYLVVILALLALQAGAAAAADIVLRLWEQDDVTIDTVFDAQMDIFEAENPGVTVARTHFTTEKLRREFLRHARTPNGPELILGPNDNIGPLVRDGLILPLDALLHKPFFDRYDPRVLASGMIGQKVYVLPIFNGNNISMFTNRQLVEKPPATFEEIIALAARFHDGSTYALVYNDPEPFWFVAFLGAFGGSVFDEAGRVSLDTPAMVAALRFVRELKVKQVVPPLQDYGTAESMFKAGKAAVFFNGLWSWNSYPNLPFAWDLAVLPTIAGKPMLPLFGSKGYSVSVRVAGPDTPPRVTAAVKKFLEFTARRDFQLSMATVAGQFPSTGEALADPAITGNRLINHARLQMQQGVPTPIRVEMRAVWDALRPGLKEVLDGSREPEAAAAEMQARALELMKAAEPPPAEAKPGK